MGSTFEENKPRFVDALRRASALDLPYPERPPRSGGRPAAVLALFGQEREGAEPSLLMTRRTDTVDHHKGQMAFPGGMSEESDVSPERTALRETEEELGIPTDSIEVLGALPPLWTVTSFWVTPVLGWLARPIPEVILRPNEGEIAEAFWIPLSTLLHADTYRREFVDYAPPGSSDVVRYPIHVFQVGPHRIWGATGAMIRNLLDRLEKLR